MIEPNQDGKKYRQFKEHVFQKAEANILFNPKRIMIFGIPGSGKSTFAAKLSQRLGLPLFHLDKYFFILNWQERDYKEFLNIQSELVEKEQWIIDGNATKSLEMRFRRAEIVFYFRFNRLLCLWRIFKRIIFKNPHISDRAEGCPENVRLRLIRYLWKFDNRVRKLINTLREKYPYVPFYELHDDREAKDWIKRLSSSQYLSEIEFQPLEKYHLPILVKWLNEPHVWKWWNEGKTWTAFDVEIKYTSYLQQYKLDQGIKKPIYPFIIFHQDKPIGYIQYYNAFDFQREDFKVQDIWKEYSHSIAALDFYIGDPSYLEKGIAGKILSFFLEAHVYTRFSGCLVDPGKDNLRAVKTYEKAGFKKLCEQGGSLVMLAKQIYLVPYLKQWPIDFEKEKVILLQTIGDWVQDIQHVGSTAIPGLAAKPVIDIMIGVINLEEADQYCVSRIQNLGYEYIQKYEAELPNRRYFQKISKTGVRTHQIHLVEIHSDWWERHLLFRDYLRLHPEVAKEYEQLKRSLAKKYSDTNEYANAKTSFIRKIEAKAREKN